MVCVFEQKKLGARSSIMSNSALSFNMHIVSIGKAWLCRQLSLAGSFTLLPAFASHWSVIPYLLDSCCRMQLAQELGYLTFEACNR